MKNDIGLYFVGLCMLVAALLIAMPHFAELQHKQQVFQSCVNTITGSEAKQAKQICLELEFYK